MINKLLEKIKRIPNKQRILLILSSIFVLMLVLNYLTPLLADDYSYSNMLDGSSINSIGDIIINQIGHYFKWGGRSISHTIAQVFLVFISKNIFNILNSLVYVLLIYLIYKIAKPEDKEKPSLLIVIHLLLWFVLPVFGQTCLWIIGSCNYLWTTLIILTFLNFYKNLEIKKDSILKIIFMFILGIIAGWTNENTSFGLLVIILGILITQKIKNKKEELPIWTKTGFIGVLIGFIILIIAPGNFIRNEAFADETFIVIKLINRIAKYTMHLTEYLLPLIIITTILISIILYHKKKIKPTIFIYLIGAFFTIYSMTLSPTFPPRAWFGVIVFMIIAIISLLFETIELHRIYKYIYINSIIIFSFLFISSYIKAYNDISNLKDTWNYRKELIETEKNNGNYNIIVDLYETNNKHNPSYGLIDLNDAPYDWPNPEVANYFKINSIEIKK